MNHHLVASPRPTGESGLQVRVLGHFEATYEGRSINPTAAKPRQVLALLALRANEIVPFSTLVDEVWGQDVPNSARTTMQTYILQIRRLIATAARVDGRAIAKQVLATSYNGYMLHMDSDAIDATRYADATTTGLDAAFAGQDHEAVQLLGAAEQLWRGPALVDVRQGVRLELEQQRLCGMRLLANEVRFEAAIRAGRGQEVLADLAALCASHPLNERLCLLQMVALTASGRAWQAMMCFRKIRSILIEELGVEPSAPLQMAYQDILHGRQPRLPAAVEVGALSSAT